MPDQSERRRFPRCPIQLPLQHAQKSPPRSKIGGGWTQSLSEGGACVELDRPLSAPTWLHIRLQTDRGAIAVEAQVVWQGKPAADPAEQGIPHGVTFKHLSPAQRQALRDLLLAQRQERRLGVRLPVDLGVTCRPRGPAGPPLRGHTGDISRGGLLIRLSQVLLPGTALDITLQPPGEPVTATGEIVWVDPGYRQSYGQEIRHGVRFAAPGWHASLALARFLLGVP